MSKLQTIPRHVIIEQIAVNIAATWYEIGCGQGMTSKHKSAKAYAKANLEKFLPKAIDTAIEMLGPNSTLPPSAKELIYEALMERHDDPTLNKYMPNVDLKRAYELADEIKRKNTRPIDIVLDNAIKSFKPKADKKFPFPVKDIDPIKDIENGKENSKK